MTTGRGAAWTRRQEDKETRSRWSFPLLLVSLSPCLLVSLPCGAAEAPAGVTIEVREGREINFLAGKDLITTYHIGPDAAKPYFWPLHAPNGVAVTRAWPMQEPQPGEQTDHVHQKSGWFSHGDVIPEGIDVKQKIKGIEGVDFWSEGDGHGRIVCVKVGEPEQGKRQARIVTDNEWR